MQSGSKIGLALAGGGPLGAIYEIGALCALEDSLQGLDLTGLHHYVGVSAGGFIAAGLANGMSPRDICALFIPGGPSAPGGNTSGENFDPAHLLEPALDEYARRAVMLPGLLVGAWWQLVVERKSTLQVLERLGAALPAGVFSNAQVHLQLAKLFSRPGRSNDFRQLRSKLTLVATHLDNGESVAFGGAGWDHVPISLAVQASAALPGLFPPVEIEDHYFVDGALKKTMHASVALDDGVDLMLCLNPLVPFDATVPQFSRVMQRGMAKQLQRIPRIADGGLPSVLSQTFRTLIHSRLEMGMKAYQTAYPDADILLFEPDHRDPTLYLANTFSYARRRELAEHAYQTTRQMLRTRKSVLAPKLARHGIRFNHRALDDAKAHLVQALPSPTRVGRAINTLQEVMDDLGHMVQLART
ncbi:MAG: hypothetical protein RLZZ126_1109 [Pseudomonadota bacterium]|jgi:NTE family protein